jgi:hypothetical protein
MSGNQPDRQASIKMPTAGGARSVRRDRRRRLVPPEILEPVRRQRRVDRGAGDRPVPEPPLNCPRVVAGEGVAAGVAKHVGVRLELQAGAGSGALDHAGEAGRGERGAALADEDERRRRAFALGAGPATRRPNGKPP